MSCRPAWPVCNQTLGQKGKPGQRVRVSNKPATNPKLQSAWHLLTFVVPPTEKDSSRALLVLQGEDDYQMVEGKT